MRNRIHAHHTRMRKRLFIEVSKQLDAIRKSDAVMNINDYNIEINEDFFSH